MTNSHLNVYMCLLRTVSKYEIDITICFKTYISISHVFVLRVRMNLLDHLEDWSSQALERAASVVAAKVSYDIIGIFAVRDLRVM